MSDKLSKLNITPVVGDCFSDWLEAEKAYEALKRKPKCGFDGWLISPITDPKMKVRKGARLRRYHLYACVRSMNKAWLDDRNSSCYYRWMFEEPKTCPFVCRYAACPFSKVRKPVCTKCGSKRRSK